MPEAAPATCTPAIRVDAAVNRTLAACPEVTVARSATKADRGNAAHAPDPAAVRDCVEAGDWEGAAEAAARVVARPQPLTPAEAWPTMMVLYLQGDMAAAESVLARTGVDADVAQGTDADRALLAAWEASIAWARAGADDCRRAVTRALALARAADDPRALAAAHIVRGLLAAAQDDRRAKDRHYTLALAAAERSGDRTLLLRVRVNRASQRLEEGDLDGARPELDAAAAVLARPGPDPHPAMAGMARTNLADLALRAGRLTAARDEFRAAAALLQRAGTAIVAFPLTGLGQTHELRGDLQQARAAFDEAVLVAEAGGIAAALGPALCGLARVFAAIGDREAGPTAARAVAVADGLARAQAYAAAGWAAAATDPAVASNHAETAITLARAGRNPATLAEALELAAVIAPGGTAESLLADAARVYADIDDPVGAARVALARARAGLGRTPAADRVLAEHRLRALGADPFAGTRSLSGAAVEEPVSVRMLGSFAVLRSGEEVPAAGWQSRKARDLLKLIVARRGRPSTREALGEALWPGADNVANRLSIALSVLRTVLDPERMVPPGHYVVASPAGVAYDPRTLRVDVDVFLQLAEAGVAAAKATAGDPEAADGEARLLLDAAAAAYTGDVLDDEPDLAVAQALREQARAAYLTVMRTLGAVCARAGDTDGAVRSWLLVLERDPYEEDTALRLVETLIAGGRHGEAARHHRLYAQRMGELGVAPRQLPAVDRRSQI
ncbi:BTAD domain-containing putative transcriptional regulator [Krasilnikovia sp. MM14-A1004]|uniref:BTAD domain-containing putative transcriptional regulator n=1 Tax=Krasilnikovia sp. MM14-A1004 TaxID=3373541 RepID=UPI00399C5630